MMILLLIPLFHLNYAGACPDGVNLNLNQAGLAERPMDKVVFSCVIDGIALHQILFFWWLKHDDNIPLYMYSDNYKSPVDQIDAEGFGMVVRETHQFEATSIQTNLTLTINVSDSAYYRCEFQLVRGDVCRSSIRTRFEDPRIIINIEKESEHTVTCLAIALSGHPKISISIVDNNGFRMLSDESPYKTHRHSFYCNAKQHTSTNITRNACFYCTVTDAIGAYNETKCINIGVMKKFNLKRVLYITCVNAVLVGLVALLITLFICRGPINHMPALVQAENTKPGDEHDGGDPDELPEGIRLKDKDHMYRLFGKELEYVFPANSSHSQHPLVDALKKTCGNEDDPWDFGGVYIKKSNKCVLKGRSCTSPCEISCC